MHLDLCTSPAKESVRYGQIKRQRKRAVVLEESTAHLVSSVFLFLRLIKHDSKTAPLRPTSPQPEGGEEYTQVGYKNRPGKGPKVKVAGENPQLLENRKMHDQKTPHLLEVLVKWPRLVERRTFLPKRVERK